MSFDPQTTNQKPMHPKDKRNLILFVALSILVWIAFEHFVIKPRVQKIEAAQAQLDAAAPVAAQAGVAVDALDAIQPVAQRLKETTRITIDTPEMLGSLPLTGNRIDDISLKNYGVGLHDATPVTLMAPSGTPHPLYAELGWLSNDATTKLPDKDSKWVVEGNTKLTNTTPVKMIWSNGDGLTFARLFAVDEHFVISVTQTVSNTGKTSIELYPYTSLTRRGVPEHHGKGNGYEGPLGYVADKLHNIPYDDIDEEGAKTFSGLNGFIGFGERYWLSAILPEQMKQTSFNFQSIPNTADPSKTIYQVDARGDKVTVGAGTSVSSTVHIFAGAKEIKVLDDYEEKLGVKHFDLAVDFGWLYFLTKPLYFMLILFNGWVGNFGVAIIMLTFMVRAAVFPLANKSYRSFAGLRKISPKMAEIKARYGSDKVRLQQELVKLYETEQVNPMAGCFPILLQMPIFFAIYRVMSIAVEMRHAPFFGWIHDLSERDPLSMFNLCGLLPFDVPSFLMIGPLSAVMLVIMLFQKHLNPPPQDQIQRDIAMWMPYVITYTLSGFAAGLVLYWAVSNLLSVIQQAVIMRMMNVPIYLFAPEAAKEHVDSHARATADMIERVKNEKAAEEEKGTSK